MPNASGGTMTGRLGNGIAVITWSGTGCVSSVTPVTVSVGVAPATNAGASVVDASTCGKNTVNLGANALAAGESGTWTLLSGTNANGIFSLPTSSSTQFTGSYGGSYVLQWSVSNQSNGCAANDTLVVTFNQLQIFEFLNVTEIILPGIHGLFETTTQSNLLEMR